MIPSHPPTILSNSAFSSLNLFPSTPTHIPPRRYLPTLSSSPSYSQPTPSPTNKKRRSSPVIPARTSSFDQSPSAPLQYYFDPPASPSPAMSSYSDRASSPVLEPSAIILDSPVSTTRSARPWSMASASVLELGSPCVFSKEEEVEARPGSVHVDKRAGVNWARPLKGELHENTLLIFGQSLQRNRRINKNTLTDSPDSAFPSPTFSSDDEPLPVTPSGQDMASSGDLWSLGPARTGLGMKGLKGFDYGSITSIKEDVGQASTDYETPIAELSTPPLVASSSIASRRHVAAPPRLFNSSQSLNSLGSPSSLAELRQLQKAAVEFQHEAQRPFKLSFPKEKRIKRKAVPVVLEEDIESMQAEMRRAEVRMFKLDVATVEISRSSSNSSANLGDTSATASDSASIETPMEPVTPPRPILGTARESPARRFYNNARATMSMIDVSPRQTSLPILIPPGSKFGAHVRSSSQPISQPSPALSLTSQRKTSGDGYSSSGESWDQPLTPKSSNSGTGSVRIASNGLVSPQKPKKSIYGNTSAFLSQLDLGLKKVVDKKEPEDGKVKHKRGLSRFLGRKS